MAKVKGPCFSLEASKSLGKTLTFQKRPSGTAIYKKSQPGAKKPFMPSWTQRNKRGVIAGLVAHWQCMTPAERLVWNNLAKEQGGPGTGYHLFIKTAQTDLPQYHGLISYFAMNEPNEDLIFDVSENNNNAALKPTPPSNCPTKLESINSKFGNCLNFDGVNDYALMNRCPISNWTMFTILLWVKLNNIELSPGNINQYFINLFQDITHTINIVNNIPAGGAVRINLQNPTNKSRSTSGTTLKARVWQHIAVSVFLDSVIYINGVATSTRPVVAMPGPLQSIGARTATTGNLNGQLDEIRIYNRTLGAAEIKKHYEIFRK